MRLPVFSHGFTSFAWALGLGLFVWVFLLAVDVDAGSAFIYGLLAGLAIFFFILRFGGPEYRR